MYVDLHLKYISAKNAKGLLQKALNSGYSIVAISINYGVNCNKLLNEKWKVVNCFSCNRNNIIKKSEWESSVNYFIREAEYEDTMDKYLSKINCNIEENYILINRANTLSIKNICDDFMLHKKNEVTDAELKQLYSYLHAACENGDSIGIGDMSASKCSSIGGIPLNSVNNGSMVSGTRMEGHPFLLSKNTSTYILRRLNIKYEDAIKMDYHKFLRENAFDLIAIEVSSPEEACSAAHKLDCDIIFFNLRKCFFSLKRSDVQNALEKGIFFEISSLNSISEDMQYYYFSLNVNNLLSIVPLNRLIVSSGSIKESEVIEPLHFLRLFFNFNSLSYKDLIGCITTVPLACIQRASVRKSLNTAVFYK
ncbi:ribonuclease P/MRP protein subunit RPP1, putative [Plasmodium ovale]|uniref:Ribonuclease P/MRP protein subunit RPP1, putative n=2 Tax=Plasmodium ovale TaxID=36330 RepID=A0A1D3TJH5_PLAOA|nr:ribonuclease P/MRP protein subunit RPP1, putative (RPP1) [Plasmodium ovale curtisi]SBS94356.1 ribonuclease P/MRP protein subunit RPP1, putative (RPP1) [Plasmodium ovale curtisi]SCP05055.1 ribonuclease P/MRP protein subunit RPP1, putative [Plasmodium ovale]